MKSVKFSKKKVGIAAAALAVAIGAALFLYKSEPARAAPQMVSAKEAMAEARAKLAKDHATNPPASAATVAKVRAEVAAAPAAAPQPMAETHAPAPGVSAPAVATSAVVPMSASSVAPVPVVAAAASSALPQGVVSVPAASSSQEGATLAPSAIPAPEVVHEQPIVATHVGEGGYFATIAALEEQTDIAERQAKLRKLLHPEQAPVAQSAAPITVAPPSSGTTFSLPLPNASRAGDSDPRLLSVIGVGGNYQAVISVRGASLTVGNGSTLSNGWTVASIQPTSVRLERGRSHKTLSMGE